MTTAPPIHQILFFTNNILLSLLLLILPPPLPQCHAATSVGHWTYLLSNIGISAMHMQLLSNDRVVIFDRTDFGLSNISLPDGKCRNDPNDTAVKIDCTAHSVEYDIASNSIRPLMVLTDVWCSSGAAMPDGRLVQTGGFNDGDHAVRTYTPCDGCDWEEDSAGLAQRRWYATNHLLPDGRQIIIGGRRQFNYEFYPKTATSSKAYSLPFLVQTNDARVENNLYPFVFLNLDGNLFIFANNRSILFDYSKNTVVKTYPDIPDGDPRNYPSSGSAVMLPLKSSKGVVTEAEVLVCGGAPKGAYVNANNRKFDGALSTCGRMKITDPNATWVMETMPLARVMSDMVMLPNGNVLIINGGSAGTAGWELGRNPVLSPVMYQPEEPLNSRFETQTATTIPRMYHSTAILLRDGRVLVGGSNPHIYYNFSGVLFPTELSLEAFSPAYLDPESDCFRPKIVSPASQAKIGYGQRFVVQFTISGKLNESMVTINMVAPSFTTHSFSMNQRLLVFNPENLNPVAESTYQIDVTTPGSGILAPSGFYLVYVVHQQIPSEGIWVQLG